MKEVTEEKGRTILFVSHNMAAIRQLCNRTILLENGTIKDIGKTDKIIDEYLKRESVIKIIDLKNRKDRKGNGKIRLLKIALKNAREETVSSFVCGEEAQLWLEYERNDKEIKDFTFYISIDSAIDQTRIATISNKYCDQKISAENGVIKISINRLPLNAGDYCITLFVEGSSGIYDWVQKAALFSVKYGNYYGGNCQLPPQSLGHVLLDYKIK